ncbi:MZT2A protein, partial [Serilophus lunatus]|nr:MZT2A protein [Serilophus lunatus]
ARVRRKQLLSAEEAELFELAQAAGSGLDPEVFRKSCDPLYHIPFLFPNTSPTSHLKQFSSVAGKVSGPPLSPPDTRISTQSVALSCAGSSTVGWRNKTSSAIGGTQVLAERSSREGSAQRMPRQPSTSRMQKAGASGKSTGGGSS